MIKKSCSARQMQIYRENIQNLSRTALKWCYLSYRGYNTIPLNWLDSVGASYEIYHEQHCPKNVKNKIPTLFPWPLPSVFLRMLDFYGKCWHILAFFPSWKIRLWQMTYLHVFPILKDTFKSLLIEICNTHNMIHTNILLRYIELNGRNRSKLG